LGVKMLLNRQAQRAERDVQVGIQRERESYNVC
jgi:hypothetical protein